MKGVALVALLAAVVAAEAQTLRIGSKRFTESYILGEILLAAAERAGVRAEHRRGLGNTAIVFGALKAGAIDVYPDYTGTVAREILKLEGNPPLEELNLRLAREGIGAGVPLGFNNGYALALREDDARRLGVRTLTELARHPALRFGLSHEFLGRADGWPGLKAAYGLRAAPTGLDHGLAYEAIGAGRIDVMDIYTTDAKIARYRLKALADDRGFFPRYDAVLVYRLDAPQRFPRAWAEFAKLERRIDEAAMIRMNAAAELEGRSFREAAALLDATGAAPASRRGFLGALLAADLARLSAEHLLLVFASLAASIAAGVPLGVAAAKVPALAPPILGAVGVIQTIPSLALLAFLIAAMGTIGTWPALAALFLYALLPIVRNTHAGLEAVGAGMRQAAMALGLSATDRLARIELPLAAPAILAGIKTSAVINVGTATIAAFVGAGGYGERIVQGLALNDHALLLAGAVPAAALALALEWTFAAGERRFAWSARARRR